MRKNRPFLEAFPRLAHLRQPPPNKGSGPRKRAGFFRLREERLLPPLPLPFALLWVFTLPAPRPGLLRAPGALPGPPRARCTLSSHRRRAPRYYSRPRPSRCRPTARPCVLPCHRCGRRYSPRPVVATPATPPPGHRYGPSSRDFPRACGFGPHP